MSEALEPQSSCHGNAADPIDLLWRIHRWCEAHNRRPTVRELDSHPDLPAYKTVKRAYGNVKQAFELAGALDFKARDTRGRNFA